MAIDGFHSALAQPFLNCGKLPFEEVIGRRCDRVFRMNQAQQFF